jgi:hypothetical protein
LARGARDEPEAARLLSILCDASALGWCIAAPGPPPALGLVIADAQGAPLVDGRHPATNYGALYAVPAAYD